MTLVRLEVIGQPRERVSPFRGEQYCMIDYPLLNNAKAVAKISQQLAKSPHRFAFYVIFSLGKKYSTAELNSEANQPNWLAERGYDLDDNINVIYTNNATSTTNYRPMTAWTLIHRIAHAATVSFRWDESWFWNPLNEMKSFIYDVPRVVVKEPCCSIFDGSDVDKRFSYGLLTMRSSRERNLQNVADVPAELLAQYVLTGKVTFHSAEDMITILKEENIGQELANYSFDDSNMKLLNGFANRREFVICNDLDYGRLQDMIDRLEEQTTLELEQFLVNLRGKTLTF